VTTAPRWEDSGQGDLLELVAMGSPSTGSADHEWDRFVHFLEFAAGTMASNRDLINPNVLRRLIRGEVAPKRIGAFTSRAVARKLIEPTGEWEISDDREGRNAGRPCRVYKWIGGAL
jgi:hypothetical protein